MVDLAIWIVSLYVILNALFFVGSFVLWLAIVVFEQIENLFSRGENVK
jgi:hypothetical protein